VTKLIEMEMVERSIFTIKRLHYNKKKTTYEYGGLLQVTARPVEQTPGVLQYKQVPTDK
jgi:hypothetical protein